MTNETVKALLARWYNLLCESGNNTKTQVRKEINEVLTKLETNQETTTYKVFYKNNELVERNTLEECNSCIDAMLNAVGDRVTIDDFKIYKEVLNG